MSPLLALGGHWLAPFALHMSAFEPKADKRSGGTTLLVRAKQVQVMLAHSWGPAEIIAATLLE